MRHLWLVGMMGSGKSEVGALVAAGLGIPFADTDEMISSRLGCSIGQLWGSRGEDAFRDMERAVIARLATDRAASVIATGGGVVLSRANIELMQQSGVVVWLTAPPDVLATRVGDGSGRPLLAGDASAAVLEEVLSSRLPMYEAVADWSVDTAGRTPDDVAAEVVERWRAS